MRRQCCESRLAFWLLPAALVLVAAGAHAAHQQYSTATAEVDAIEPGEPGEAAKESAGAEMLEKDDAFVLGYVVPTIDGKDQDLHAYKGKVVLVVNVASRCGLTPQYEDLQKLYAKHEKDGLVILGFPANDFMGQEPGTNEEIATFCRETYDVKFPMFSKISVKGDEAHPLFKRLSGLEAPAGGEPTWNFTKYLIGRDGRAVQRFGPRTKPMDEPVTTAIKAELEKGTEEG